jgi:hypothetical protein
VYFIKTFMKIQNLKTLLTPHLLVLGTITVILALYFTAAFFEHKGLKQNDVLQGMGAGQEATEFRKATGEEALWTNSMFGGMPIYILNVYYSGDLISPIKNALRFLPSPADLVFLNFICFYILLVVCRCKPWISFVGAFSYAFTSYNLISIEAGHVFKSLSMAFIPLLFAGIMLAFRGKYILGLAITSLALALELSSQHYQIAYYFGFLAAFYGLSEFISAYKEKALPRFFKAAAVLLLALVLGIGTNLGRIWATSEYTKYSIRGKSELAPKPGEAPSTGLDRDYAFQWSNGKMETFTLLIPYFYGGSSTEDLSTKSETYKVLKKNGVPAAEIKGFIKNAPLYWGDQPFTSGPVYAGIIIVFLFVLGAIILENNLKYWLIAGVIISIILSWGKNFEFFNYFMFDYFPAYNKFRAVSMAIVIALFCFPLMACLTLQKILSAEDKQIFIKPLLQATAGLGGLLLLVIVFAGMADFAADSDSQMPEWLLDPLKADRASLLRTDAFRSLILTALTAGLLYFYLKNKTSIPYVIGGIALLSVFDLWMVDKRYLANDDFSKNSIQTAFSPGPEDEYILKDTSQNYRVLNMKAGNPYTDAKTSYFHKSIGGYHGFKMRRYQDIVDKYLFKNNMNVINMLNTKYIITTDPKSPVQQNPGALGNAWFVTKVISVNSPDEELNALDSLNPSAEAVVDITKFKVSKNTLDSGGTIRLTDYKPNKLTYESNNLNPGFAVFSEIYYPEGWSAYIDGNEIEIKRVNYILRALEIPAGKHKIEFKFAPASYTVGNKVMLVSSLMLLLTFVAGIGIVAWKEVTPKV